MPLLSHFDVFAPFYDHFIKPKNSTKLKGFAHLPIEGILLDAGGGTGRVANSLKGTVSHFVVADLSYSMLRQAIKKDGLQAVCSQSEELPFPDESFERVIMVDALHHVYNFKVTARELWRVVKPGGYIVIEEPDVRTLTVKLVALVEKVALMRSHFINPIKIKALFSYSNAITQIERDGYTAWVIVEKRCR